MDHDPGIVCAAVNATRAGLAVLPSYWVADTGSPVDLISSKNVTEDTLLHPMGCTKTLNTANGQTRTSNTVKLESPAMGSNIQPMLLANTPRC